MQDFDGAAKNVIAQTHSSNPWDTYVFAQQHGADIQPAYVTRQNPPIQGDLVSAKGVKAAPKIG